MANRKNTKNKKKEEIIVDNQEKPIVEEKSSAHEYDVILATPTYYIVNKDGFNITIKELNNYKKGDKVIL